LDTENSDKPILEYTGERYMPEVQGKIELEHFHRYIFASHFVKGKLVLDIACGEGYGSNMLAGIASHVVGVDISEEAVEHAKQQYQKPNLEFMHGSCDAIPLADSSIDVVVSFETIEHHDRHEEMLQEIKRVLKPDGILIISSPDKYEYSDKPGGTNIYHVKELYRHEFDGLIAHHFQNMVSYGQRVLYGSAILRDDGPSSIYTAELTDDTFVQAPGMQRPLYLIAVASDAKIPPLPSSILEPPDNHIDTLNAIIAKRDYQISLLNEYSSSLNGKIFLLTENLSSLTNSFSWRITKPLRVVQRIVQEGGIRQEHKERLLGLVRRIYKKFNLP
jgi:ubiquinone/menaquinone biosynthesis C-methylase UbiE